MIKKGGFNASFFYFCKFMGRILALDYGRKRTGIAVTDGEKIIATGLCTVNTKELLKYIGEYLKVEDVECIVIGEPKDMNNRPSDSTKYIEPFVGVLKKKFPEMKIERYDERFTSKIAFQTMIDGGLSKSKRRDKAMVDKISAVLILQSYLKSLE
jgi:putative Holliday junction resolvase